MATTVPIHIVTNGFMVADDGPLLLVQEEHMYQSDINERLLMIHSSSL